MCITPLTSFNQQAHRDPTWWDRVCWSPLSLLSLEGVLGFSLAVWAGLSLELAPQAFNLLYGGLPFFLFGLLLQHYPRWLRSRAVAQLRFSVIGLLLLTAQLFWLLNAWDLIGLLPYLIALSAAWYLLLDGLRQLYRLAPGNGYRHERWINHALGLGALLFLLGGVGGLSGEFAVLWLSILLGLGLFLLPTLLLFWLRLRLS